MIDLSKAKWILSNEESFICHWLDENCFSVTLEQPDEHTAVFHIFKNGQEKDLFLTIPQDKETSLRKLIASFVEQFH